ncbi:MAG TPA: NrpR regulatory domain-containing protein [Candidatus Sulfotelmatobacter sp.]|nr:NrpR regulatory domain-containing protein [Candidatus Sulfotelmatobacter sp.]
MVAEAKEPIGSAEIAEKLKAQGLDMPERTVRYHLKELSEKGLMKGLWKEGRIITDKGIEELGNALVFDKVGFMNSRIDNMSYQMDFDLEKKSGRVILNLSLIRKADFNKALKIMAPVFTKKLTIGDKVLLVEAGRDFGSLTIPAGWVGLGTLCSINLNGILLKHGIAMEPKMGGLLQFEGERPVRFTEIINYDGTTLDPHEILIKSRMTGVSAAAAGAGKILAGLREVPAATVHEAEAIIRKTESAGLGRVLLIGKPGQTVLGMPIGVERVGIVVPGGLNPIAAVEEAGIETASKALSALIEADQLVSFNSL